MEVVASQILSFKTCATRWATIFPRKKLITLSKWLTSIFFLSTEFPLSPPDHCFNVHKCFSQGWQWFHHLQRVSSGSQRNNMCCCKQINQKQINSGGGEMKDSRLFSCLRRNWLPWRYVASTSSFSMQTNQVLCVLMNSSKPPSPSKSKQLYPESKLLCHNYMMHSHQKGHATPTWCSMDWQPRPTIRPSTSSTPMETGTSLTTNIYSGSSRLVASSSSPFERSDPDQPDGLGFLFQQLYHYLWLLFSKRTFMFIVETPHLASEEQTKQYHWSLSLIQRGGGTKRSHHLMLCGSFPSKDALGLSFYTAFNFIQAKARRKQTINTGTQTYLFDWSPSLPFYLCESFNSWQCHSLSARADTILDELLLG